MVKIQTQLNLWKIRAESTTAVLSRLKKSYADLEKDWKDGEEELSLLQDLEEDELEEFLDNTAQPTAANKVVVPEVRIQLPSRNQVAKYLVLLSWHVHLQYT